MSAPKTGELYGVSLDMPAAKYHAMAGASSSQLRAIWQATPAHFKAAQEDHEVTPAMMMGTFAHALILEPTAPLPSICIRPDFYNQKLKEFQSGDVKPDGEDWKDWSGNSAFCKAFLKTRKEAGCLVLKRSEHDAVLGMAKSAAAHPDSGPILTAGRSEVSMRVWSEEHQVWVKCRLDWVPDRSSYIADIKTTVSASERDFEKKATNEGLHMQAALYLAVWNALCGADDARTGFRFIAVENTPPYAVNVFEASQEFIARGTRDFASALAIYSKCVRENNWPAYAPGIKELNMAKWAE